LPPPSSYMQREIYLHGNCGRPRPGKSSFSPSRHLILSLSLWKLKMTPCSRPQFFHDQNGGKRPGGSRLANGGANVIGSQIALVLCNDIIIIGCRYLPPMLC